MRSLVERFRSAGGITNPRIRWRVLTGMAYAMTEDDMREVVALEDQRITQRLARLRELDAPAVILRVTEESMTKLRAGTDATSKLFVRVRRARADASANVERNTLTHERLSDIPVVARKGEKLDELV